MKIYLNIFLQSAPLSETLRFLCVVTNISNSIFLLYLKAAFTKLAHIRVHDFLYSFTLVKFWMLFTKIKFQVSNICDLFSHIR